MCDSRTRTNEYQLPVTIFLTEQILSDDKSDKLELVCTAMCTYMIMVQNSIHYNSIFWDWVKRLNLI